MYELHPLHQINVATLPCEIQNSENVILQLDYQRKLHRMHRICFIEMDM